MKTNPAFHNHDAKAAAEFIRKHNFGAVITADDNGRPYANHLPLLVRETAGGVLKIIGHMAKSNQQWKHFEAGREALCVFHGPHGYITPAWYGDEDVKVPTWDYTAVHVSGMARTIHEPARLEQILRELTAFQESQRKTPWREEIASEVYQQFMPMIVGFEIESREILGLYKLSQNRPMADRLNVVKQLKAEGTEASRELARLIEDTLKN